MMKLREPAPISGTGDLRWLATIQLGVKDPHDCADLVAESKQEGAVGIEGAPLAQDASQATNAPQADRAHGFSFDVTGKGDATVRELNPDELDHIAKQQQ